MTAENREKNKNKKIKNNLESVWFFGFLLKTICFQNLSYLFFYFFMIYYKLFIE